MKKVRSKKYKLRIKIEKVVNKGINNGIYWYFVFDTSWYSNFDNHQALFDMTSINIKKQL